MNDYRRMSGFVGMAAGALLVSPLIALLASPLASADPVDAATVGGGGDITTLGPYTFDGITDTLSYNDVTFAAGDNLAIIDGDDLDIFYGGPDTYGILLTDPGVFQVGFEDVNGVTTVIDNFPPTTFLPDDPGLADIGGGAASGADSLIAGLLGL